MKIIFFVVIFLLIGGYIIYSNTDTDFSSAKNTFSFIKEIGKWVFQVGKSTVKTVGYAANQSWLPNVNKTNETNRP